MRTIVCGVVLAVVLFSATGCGGSASHGPRLSHDQFAHRMQVICEAQNAKFEPVLTGTTRSVKLRRGEPAYDRLVVAAVRDALNELRKLNPPMRDEKRLATAFEHWSEGVDHLDDLYRAMEKKDGKSGTKAFNAMATEVRAIARLIPDYPAQRCWGPT